ncbi:MAG: MFS transporter [Gammaproteobacteria bacterium]|nr:MFS transporter [Gammaproteobacteria bacterium]
MDTAPARNFRQQLLAILGVCFVVAMVALDQTVIGTALPTIVAELKGFDLYAWVGTSYLLCSIIAVPIFGKLGDEHGRKPYALAAILLFTAASMLCGLARDMLELVLARGLQGIGGGMLVATAFATVADLFPEPRERLRWQVLLSGAFGLANAFGPTLGGFLTEYWGWRWVFFVNLPVGVVSLWFVWRYLPRIRHSDQPPAQLDWPGAALIALTLASLQLLVEWLPQHDKPAALLGLLAAIGAVAGALLLWWERRCANPILPLDMLARNDLKPLFALSLVTGFCMFALMYYIPLLLQGGFGMSPNHAGLLITPLAVCITVGSIANGRIVARLAAPKRMLYAGLGFFGLASLALARMGAGTPDALIAAAMMSAGIGLGILLPNMTLFTQSIAPRARLGVATAMLQSTRMIGGMLGMAIIGTLVSHRYVAEVDALLRANDGLRWAAALGDPQILLDRGLADDFGTALARTGHDAAALLAGARDSLIASIHVSQWVIAALVALALLVAYRVPPVRLGRDAGPDPVAGE